MHAPAPATPPARPLRPLAVSPRRTRPARPERPFPPHAGVLGIRIRHRFAFEMPLSAPPGRRERLRRPDARRQTGIRGQLPLAHGLGAHP